MITMTRTNGSVVRAGGSARGRRSGFTLVELLVVIGIILVLMSILLPAVFAVRRMSERKRIQGDLQTIATGLEAYKQVFKDYPKQFEPNPATGMRKPLLVQYLIGPNAEGIQVSGTYDPASPDKGSKKWGPYIPAEKFRYNADILMDRNGNEIMYYPRYNKYDMRTGLTPPTTMKGHLLGRAAPSPGQAVAAGEIRAMFNINDGFVNNDPTLDRAIDHVIHTLYMLGDGEDRTGDDGSQPVNFPNNKLDVYPGTPEKNETLTFDGPFILVSAGPDKLWGLGTRNATKSYQKHSKVDDVYNFER